MSQQQVTTYFVSALIFLVLLVGCFLTYRSMLRMSGDSLYYLNLAAQFGLIIMGVLLALGDAWVKRHSNIVLVAFALVGALAMFAAIRQGQENTRETNEEKGRTAEAQREASESNAKLAASMNRLGTQTGEIQRVQGLNTDLQKALMGQSDQLLDSSKRITDLSKQAIDVTTGGDSFCYMYLSPQFSLKGLTPIFIQMGRQPLYDIHVQIVDIEKLDELEKESKSSGRSLQFLNEANFFITIGNMRPRSSYYPGAYGQIVLAGDSQVHNVNAYFDARNGDWNQQIQLRRVGNTWSQAMRVFRWTGQKDILMFQEIPKDFPGVPDWSPLTLKAKKPKR